MAGNKNLKNNFFDDHGIGGFNRFLPHLKRPSPEFIIRFGDWKADEMIFFKKNPQGFTPAGVYCLVKTA